MEHFVRDLEAFDEFLTMAATCHMRLIKYEQHPTAEDVFILTIGRHDNSCIFRHYLEDATEQDAVDLIFIAGFKSARGQWTINSQNSPSSPLDTPQAAGTMPADVP
jgi:hypothetical protein